MRQDNLPRKPDLADLRPRGHRGPAEGRPYEREVLSGDGRRERDRPGRGPAADPLGCPRDRVRHRFRRLEVLRARLAEEGRPPTAVVGDVSDPAARRAMADAAVGAYGRLDVAVANAGVLPLSDVRETSFVTGAVVPVDGGYLAR